jgi:DNA-binding transcriptional LysR family regulator
MLDVYRLRLLRELDRRGTLAAVARALSYSPSAISQQLSQLEAETGVTLLEPVGRGVRLTPLARLLVTHTEAILERLEEAEAELRAAATEVRGTLRVASFQSVLFALIPSVLTRLAERHPGLRLEITHEQAIPAFDGLLAHEFDLVLGEEYPGVAFPPVTGARTQLLARDELFLVLPSHGPHAVDVADDRPFRLADLAGVPWVLDPPETAPGAWARNACREAGFEPDVRYAGSDLLFEILLAERGHAASVIPGMLLSAVPRPDARIKRIPGRPHRRLTTGVRAGAAGQPAIRALREALRQAVREAGEPDVPDAGLVPQVRDDLRQRRRGLDARRGGADDPDGVHGAVGGVAGGRVAHPLDLDREADVDVERGVPVDDDVPAGRAQIPVLVEDVGAVPGGGEPEQRAAVAHAGHDHLLRRDRALFQRAGRDADRLPGGAQLAGGLDRVEGHPEGVGEVPERRAERDRAVGEPAHVEVRQRHAEAHDVEQKVR